MRAGDVGSLPAMDGAKWCVLGGSMGAKASNQTAECSSGASHMVPTLPMSDHLPSVPVLLIVKREVGVRGDVDVFHRACKEVKPL